MGRHMDTIEEISYLTNQTVTIETERTDTNIAKCHLQEQSKLFGLPKELRDKIFTYTTWSKDIDYGAGLPGFEKHTDRRARLGKTTSTTFLLTCRRAWLEASHLPMRQAVTTAGGVILGGFTLELTPNNRLNFDKVPLFVSIGSTKPFDARTLISLLGTHGMCPKMLTITCYFETS
ncbi:uncharacterized protein LTR77_002677 [Saxophila tyrrhenica]|uniref:Uncharacterized protein n=1 Tax=Saxophila tyrrhenica TaxID=1690608 RepID=A0AAV9PFP7_9PEZI|nr:hypothetical protein LTR77_002677 [Saxophila tyrrhenica]